MACARFDATKSSRIIKTRQDKTRQGKEEQGVQAAFLAAAG
jgi:hypothetical protein